WNRPSNINGAIVDTTGQVIDSIFIACWIATWSHPFVSTNGTNYFIVWQDERNSDSDIYGARVDSSGTVLDTVGFPVSTAEGDQACPTVAFDGTDYIVLWEDYRNVFTDIYGARVSTAGIVLDTFAVVTQEGNQFSPVLTKGPGEKLLVTYSGFVDSINTRPANTMRIWGSLFIPPVGVKEDKPISKPLSFSLRQNFPNPIFSETQITYSIPGNSNAITDLKIYNATGRLVKTLVNKNQLTGFYTVRWDCRDDKGKPIPNGIYFYRLSVGEKIAVKKMVVIR
ncbi:T9SS type A sorting domain-containing protein, partial [candidate division WOR-3 bacterium]|nr:T9SS type A sorting domain-containing protein [candidate division WOR-3 bacterium]